MVGHNSGMDEFYTMMSGLSIKKAQFLSGKVSPEKELRQVMTPCYFV